MVRRLARAAGLDYAGRLSPHSLRHTFVTLAFDAGVSLWASRMLPAMPTPVLPGGMIGPATTSTGQQPTPGRPTSPATWKTWRNRL
jgi:hypothetical protein